jgi:dihydroxyacetone kinase-like predicted kinase
MDSPNDEDALNTTPDCEIITLYYGEDIGEDEANSLAEQLQDLWPKQEIEVIPGGQPHYHYILSME